MQANRRNGLASFFKTSFWPLDDHGFWVGRTLLSPVW
jgi:hypothetical protein